MIKAISLSNFQSHRNTSIKFAPGVNVLVGKSDSGKSAVLRALYWLIENRPSPGSLLSHWAKDKEGKQIDKIEVTVQTKLDTISRYKDTQNAYRLQNGNLDPIEFEAIGKDVPEAIQKALNISEVNLQKQMDSPFLLSESAGEIARFFNSVIKLEDIDKCLSSADSLKRRTNADLKTAENQQNQLSQALEGYSWVENACSSLEKVSNMEERLDILNSESLVLEESHKKWLEIETELTRYKSLNNIIRKEKDAETMSKELLKITNEYESLKSIFDQFKSTQRSLSEIPAMEPIEKQLVKTEAQHNELKELIEAESGMEEILSRYSEFEKQILDCDKKIKEYAKLLPDVCPLCGQAIKEDNCEQNNKS